MVKAGMGLSRPLALACGVLAVVAVVSARFSPASAQVVLTGQNVVPAYEGWEQASDGTKYFGTLFVDSQDNIPAVNGCTYELSPSAASEAS